MTAERPPKAEDVDAEIQRLSEAYAALCGLDRAAQVRAMQWLTERLENDARQKP